MDAGLLEMHRFWFATGGKSFEDETKAAVTVNFMHFYLSLSEYVVRPSLFFLFFIEFTLKGIFVFLVNTSETINLVLWLQCSD